MNLGDILKMAADKDLSQKDKKNKLSYQETIDDEGKFCIKFQSDRFPQASIECSVPYTGQEHEKNYLRTHFLSMVYNAAIYGMAKLHNHKKKKL